MKTICIKETDPRFKTDPNFRENCGSFSVIQFGVNDALKKLSYYAEPDKADVVGFCDGLNISQNYDGKPNFCITVFETINALTTHHLESYRVYKAKLLGMANQITRLYRKYNIPCETLYCGCDTDYWQQTKEKRKDKFQFLFINSSNVRSGLDQALIAFDLAFRGNNDVELLVKDTNQNTQILQSVIKKFNDLGSNIKYFNERTNRSHIRDLYSSSHVCLNVLRMTSFGFPLLESSACGCYNITGDIEPTNEMLNGSFATMLKPMKQISIGENLNRLVNNVGLLNCYPNFEYTEIPMFWEYDVYEYANKLKEIYDNWNKYSKIDTRTPVVDNWKWETTAKNLIKHLEE